MNKYNIVGYQKSVEKYGEKVMFDCISIQVIAKNEKEALSKAKKIVIKKKYKVKDVSECRVDEVARYTDFLIEDRKERKQINNRRHKDLLKAYDKQAKQFKRIADALKGNYHVK